MIHYCAAPISMLSNYFGKKQVLRGTFGAIENLGKNTYKMWVWKSLNDWSVQNKSLR